MGLDSLFEPGSVAVIGASSDPHKISYCCLESLVQGGFAGPIYPVNPSSSEILGLTAYPSLEDIPGDVDMAMIAVAASEVPSVLRQCARKGTKGAVIITAGFKELGTEPGARLQDEIASIANGAGISIIGPNTMGIVNPHHGLNATFLPTFNDVPAGKVAIVAQSGGVCSFLLHSAINENAGISLAAGLGNRANVDFADIVEYLGGHSQTGAIALYVEGLNNPRRLMETAAAVAPRKPIVAYKPQGRLLDEAARSHTGSLAGSREAYEAAFTQAGVVSVQDMEELLDVARALAFLPPPAGDRVAVLSLQAGPGMIAASVCLRHGLSLAGFSPRSRDRLKRLARTPSFSYNPLDMAGCFTQSGLDHRTWQEIVQLALGDDEVDAVILSTLYHRLDVPFMEAIADVVRDGGPAKPLIVCRDSPLGAARREIAGLQECGIPVYPSPARAARAMAGLVRYGKAGHARRLRA